MCSIAVAQRSGSSGKMMQHREGSTIAFQSERGAISPMASITRSAVEDVIRHEQTAPWQGSIAIGTGVRHVRRRKGVQDGKSRPLGAELKNSPLTKAAAVVGSSIEGVAR